MGSEKLERIVEGLSKSAIGASLTHLDVNACGVTVEEAKAMCDRHGMAQVQVVQEGPGPLAD